jgi:hypothetical protein
LFFFFLFFQEIGFFCIFLTAGVGGKGGLRLPNPTPEDQKQIMQMAPKSTNLLQKKETFSSRKIQYF